MPARATGLRGVKGECSRACLHLAAIDFYFACPPAQLRAHFVRVALKGGGGMLAALVTKLVLMGWRSCIFSSPHVCCTLLYLRQSGVSKGWSIFSFRRWGAVLSVGGTCCTYSRYLLLVNGVRQVRVGVGQHLFRGWYACPPVSNVLLIYYVGQWCLSG